MYLHVAGLLLVGCCNSTDVGWFATISIYRKSDLCGERLLQTHRRAYLYFFCCKCNLRKSYAQKELRNVNALCVYLASLSRKRISLSQVESLPIESNMRFELA